MKSRQLESTILVTVAVLITAVLITPVQTADHPMSAVGIALQTLAGLFAAVQLWANNASDALVGWAARQVDSNRWHIVGLLDGRFRSLLIAATWLFSAQVADRLFVRWGPGEIIGWPIAIILAANFVIAAIVFFLALFMYMGAHLLEAEPLPEGEALTGLQARLAGNDWVWPIAALAFLVGGMLQIAAA